MTVSFRFKYNQTQEEASARRGRSGAWSLPVTAAGYVCVCEHVCMCAALCAALCACVCHVCMCYYTCAHVCMCVLCCALPVCLSVCVLHCVCVGCACRCSILFCTHGHGGCHLSCACKLNPRLWRKSHSSRASQPGIPEAGELS